MRLQFMKQKKVLKLIAKIEIDDWKNKTREQGNLEKPRDQ